MRAHEPDSRGIVERDGVRLAWEVFSQGEPTIFFVPTWSIIHSRIWKAQVPHFARHARVVTMDGRGNGGSDRPPTGYDEREFASDSLAVMDATGTDRAIVVALSAGAGWALLLAAEHPDRVAGLVLIAPALPIPPRFAHRRIDFDAPDLPDEGWSRYNAQSWRRDHRGFLEFFFGQCLTEPHSTKQIEDAVGWGLESDPETLIATQESILDVRTVKSLAAKVRCPVLVIHGTDDAIVPHDRGARTADLMRGRLAAIEGGGHLPNARDPVRTNLLIEEFAGLAPRPSTWARGRSRRRRALFISSPIGLGHAQRDLAIAQALRLRQPDLEIDWLAQDPVTRVLSANGERIHPASRLLASESSHIESESAEHDLHCFQAWRRMDEILVSNFMVFHDVARAEPYDLWIGDEAWELDYYLHENPELKTAAYVWLTDFVGWLPMPDGGDHEASLTADYNAEMIEHIARFPRIRDRALFVGGPEDIVPDAFGPGLPRIRDWTESNYQFPGYILPFDPEAFRDVAGIRDELGFRADEKVCIVSVGGTSVGEHLLRRCIAAYPEAKRRMPELRMVVVSGPRIDPASLPQVPGIDYRPYVHDLYRHLAVCDLAVVQGGLSTTMELTANRRPFLYFPLRHHFEQNFHVRWRLDHHRAGRRMDYDTATPEVLAAAMVEEMARPLDYRPIEPGAADRAAQAIADLL